MNHDFATLEIFRSLSLRRNQRWRWRLRHLSGRIIAESGEGYANRDECEAMGRKVVSGQYAQ